MSIEYKTGKALFTLGDEARYFIEASGMYYPRVRLYESPEERDQFAAQYRNGQSWDTDLGYPLGTTSDSWENNPAYTLVSYDERFNLSEGTFIRFSSDDTERSFFVTDTEHPGYGWGLGVFREGERERSLGRARRRLQQFRDDPSLWSYSPFEISTSYADVVSVPDSDNRARSTSSQNEEEDNMSESTEQFRLFYNTEHRNGFIITNSKDPGGHWQGTFGDIEDRGVKTLNAFRDGTQDWEATGYYRDLSDHIGNEYSATEPDSTDAQTKLDALWNALAQEAKDRGWCDEFDTFAAANGAPERLFRSKVRVVLELDVDTRDPDLSDVYKALKGEAEYDITEWKAV